MRRDRVAVAGAHGLFTESVQAALNVQRGTEVRYFDIDENGALSPDIQEFEPNVLVIVERLGLEIWDRARTQVGESVGIVTLNPVEPTMSVFVQAFGVPATLDIVIDAVTAVRFLASGGRTLRETEPIR